MTKTERQGLLRWQRGSTTWWAARAGYFPNGKVAARWVSQTHKAGVFTRSEARSIWRRVELQPGDRVEFLPIRMQWQADGTAKLWVEGV